MADEKFKIVAEIKMPKVDIDKTWSKKSKALFNKNLTRARIEGVEMAATQLQKALYASLQASVWDWPRTTVRQNGSTVDSPRNIVDTGALLASQKVSSGHKVTKSFLSITYGVPYASLVHYGGAVLPYGNMNADTKILPARPWVTAVLEGTHGQEKVDPGMIVVDHIINMMGDMVT